MSIEHFPYQPDDPRSMENPAVQLFGNRLFADQSVSELLVEFLLVVMSPKWFGVGGIFKQPLPPESWFHTPSRAKLNYAPKARLNLKLFSFLGASRLDSRHRTHREHHVELLSQLRKQIELAGPGDHDEVIRTLENLFLGFQGAGRGRTWCAQSFLPVSPALLAGETLWNETKARKKEPNSWEDMLESANTYLTMNKHRFLARGGELLYLQVCRALRQPQPTIREWNERCCLQLSNHEQDHTWLREQLDSELAALMDTCPRTLTELADFIDRRVDRHTALCTDGFEEEPRSVNAGWCNEESWREGYLFAVELHRLLKSRMDVVDRIYLLEMCCAMQVLRILAMQSERVGSYPEVADSPGYRLAISAPEEKRPAIRRLSQHAVKRVEKAIFRALRSSLVKLPEDESEREKKLKQADKSYGGKLYVGLAKRIGLIVPKRGAGARYVLTEQLLRLLVVTALPPGGRMSFQTFKQVVEARHGLVFDADGMSRASQWLDRRDLYLPADTDAWLQEMMEAAGFLIHLSDSCALVHNPADRGADVV